MSTKIKTHWAIQYERHGEQRVRSLCGRSSSTVLNTQTILTGQNVTKTYIEVTCSFCQKMLRARPALAA